MEGPPPAGSCLLWVSLSKGRGNHANLDSGAAPGRPTMTRVVKKVLAYVTRGDELLVFTHHDYPEAGLQVPAGTLEEGEDPEHAALREVREESGLTDVRVVSFLGRYLYDAPAGRGEVYERYVFHIALVDSALDAWLHHESDPSGGGPPVAFCFFWMSLDDPALLLAGGQGHLLSRLRDGK